MKNLLGSNVFLIALFVAILCYTVYFISTDVVLSDKIYKKYLDEKYETKYNEYKDLDIDLAEFEKELIQFETPKDTSYNLDYFYVDSIFVLVPLILMVFGFSGVFLILVLFHRKLHVIRFVDFIRTSLLSFLIFYLPEVNPIDLSEH